MNIIDSKTIRQLNEVRQEKRAIMRQLATEKLQNTLSAWDQQKLQMKLERLTIIENHCKLNLPVALRFSSEDIKSAKIFLDQTEWLIDQINKLLPNILTALDEQKSRLVPWQLSEVGSVILDSFGDQSKNPLLRTGAELLSTWLSAKGLDTSSTLWVMQQLVQFQNVLSELMNKLAVLWIDLWWTQINKPLSSLPDLQRIEYIDLVQDIVQPSKKWWSIVSLIAQFRTGKRTWDITREIRLMQEEMILMKTITIPEKRAKLNELEEIIHTTF